MPTRVLLTGASGFIGGHLLAALCERGIPVRAMFRQAGALQAVGRQVETVTADLLDPPALARACADVNLIIHCAGHAHAHGATAADARHHFETNLVGTRNLGDAAVAAGVSRLVFLSSVKAVGAPGAECVAEDWPHPPETPYGRAKREAEAALREIAAEHPLEIVILRPAMVYGPGSRGNLERMARGIRAGWFPPLPETGQRRSLVHVDDVVAAVLCVMADERAVGHTYFVAHPQAHSGAELQAAIRRALGIAPQRWHVPQGVLRTAGRLGDWLGRLSGRRFPIDGEVLARLLGPECYDPAAIYRDLGWQARVSLANGLAGLFRGAGE